jgi:hypothetical protein
VPREVGRHQHARDLVYSELFRDGWIERKPMRMRGEQELSSGIETAHRMLDERSMVLVDVEVVPAHLRS